MDVKDIIKTKRLEKGLTNVELGALVGVSGSTISRWESGNIATMKQSRIAALAKALGISPIDIIGDDTEITYSRTPDISYRLADLAHELHNRKETFVFDDEELTPAQVEYIRSMLINFIEQVRAFVEYDTNKSKE